MAPAFVTRMTSFSTSFLLILSIHAFCYFACVDSLRQRSVRTVSSLVTSQRDSSSHVNNTNAIKGFLGGTRDIMVRQCVEERFLRFESIKAIAEPDTSIASSERVQSSSRTGGGPLRPHRAPRQMSSGRMSSTRMSSTQMSHALQLRQIWKIWDTSDKIKLEKKGIIFTSYTQRGQNLQIELNDLYDDFERTHGMSYQALEKSCTGGAGDAVRHCVAEAAPESIKSDVQMHQDLMVYNSVRSPSRVDRRAVKAKDFKLLGAIKRTSFQYRTAERKCKKAHRQKIKHEVLEFVTRELLEPVVTTPQGTCAESVRSTFCPEGTIPGFGARQNNYGMMVGAAAGTWVAGAAIGAILSLDPVLSVDVLGAASSAPGAAARLALAAAGGAAAGIGSRGPCACNVRPCEFSSTIGKCIIGGENSRNIFANTLPPIGMKCISNPDTLKCGYATCEASDYQGRDGKAMKMLLRRKLFGKIGRTGTDVYNCLSKNGSPTSSLMVSKEISPEVPNTATQRYALYMEANLEHAR